VNGRNILCFFAKRNLSQSKALIFAAFGVVHPAVSSDNTGINLKERLAAYKWVGGGLPHISSQWASIFRFERNIAFRGMRHNGWAFGGVGHQFGKRVK